MCVPNSVPSGKQLLAKFVLNSEVFLVFLAACINYSQLFYTLALNLGSLFLHRFTIKKKEKKVKMIVGFN